MKTTFVIGGLLSIAMLALPLASASGLIAVKSTDVTVTYDVEASVNGRETQHSGTATVGTSGVSCGGGGSIDGSSAYRYICR